MIIVLGSGLWWRDCVREGNREYTIEVREGIKIGFMIFIVSEVLLFVSVVWGYIHVSRIPSIEIFKRWPGTGLDAWELPLWNTVVLLTSGCCITVGHNKIIRGQKLWGEVWIWMTVILGIIFIGSQYIEYKNSGLSMSDGVVRSVFYISTGLHGLHIIVGTLYIIIIISKISDVSRYSHTGLELSIIYWHFVDIVWIVIYVLIYHG